MQPVIPAYRLAKTAGAVQLQRSTAAPAALAPHDIRVRVHAASLNYRDLLPLRGGGDDLRDGLVPLSDGAGMVLEVGATVTQWRTGERVMPTFFRDWQAGPFKKQYLASALGGAGADHVLELGGPDTFGRSIAALAAGGKIAQIGVLTGFCPTANLLPIQFLNSQIHGICVGSGAHFSAMNRLLEAHQIKPVIGTEFSFEQAPQAYDSLASGQHFGKVVITL